MKKFLVKVNGIQYDVEVEETADQSVSSIKQPVTNIEDVKPLNSGNTQSSEAITVTAPIPGTILKINVNNGDAIKINQVLLVIEAMKMENEIISPVDGKVAVLHVENGKKVGTGDLLLSLISD